MMMKTVALGVVALGLATTAPANAAVVTFASFSDPTTVDNFRFVNAGNSSSKGRTADATLYSTATGNGGPGAAVVRFSFTQPLISDFVKNVNALFTYNATIARGTPATFDGTNYQQGGIAGSFSFLTTSAITISGPHFVTHTYAAGSNLLSGTFTKSVLFGAGSSATTSSSTLGGATVVFSSDFLDFSNTVDRDRGLTLTAIAPKLSIHSGLNQALSGFRATAGGQFSSDPAPLVNGLAVVPEPSSWLLMIAGFGLVGVSARRRSSLATA